MNGLAERLRLRRIAIDVGTSLAVVVVSLLLGILIVTAAGYSPGDTINAFWNGAFVGSLSIDGTLETTIPLVLSGLAWIVAFRAGRINVGIEGQILAGGVTATAVGLYVHLPIGIHLPLTVLAAVGGGAIYAGFAAALWAWRNVNEIISTFMLNLIASLFVTYLVTGPLQEPAHQQPISPTITGSARWPGFLGQIGLSWDIALVPVGVALVAWTLHRTTAGFRLRMTGENPEAARHVGVPVKAVGGLALVASGGLAGLAASSLLLSTEGGALQSDFSSNFGFNGIAVALLARNSPIGCVPAALLFAALREGGGLVETEVGIDTSLVDVTFGIVVILAAASLYIARHGWRIPDQVRARLQRPRAQPDLTEAG
jgi:simple sugar transport system permease protein